VGGLLADSDVTTVVVERKGRHGCMNAELVEAVLSAHGRCRLEALTSLRVRLYRRRSAKNRAWKALDAAAHG
jgi:putative resolvase